MTFKVIVDWGKDGAYGASDYGGGSYGGYDYGTDDVTSRVRPSHGALTAEYGRDQATALAPTVAGRGSLVLDNRDRRFSPRFGQYPSETLEPSESLILGFNVNLKPARPVTITRKVGDTTYTLFSGHTDDNPINPDIQSKTVQLSLVDWLADLRGQSITTPLYRSIRTGDAINYVLDAVGWSAVLRDIDPGATVMPWWWEDNTDALTAIEKLVQSEGPPAMITQGAGGEIVFRDRHHRLQRSESVTSQATFTTDQSSVQPYMIAPFAYDEAWRNIVNNGLMNVDVRQPQPLQAVWTSDVKIVMTAGEVKFITVTASDPFYDAVTPVSGTDYTLISGSVVPTLLRTSGQAATILLTAGGSGAQIRDLQLRAHPVTVGYTVQVSVSDDASIADYGLRSFPTELPWCSPADTEAVLQNAVALRADSLPIVQATFLCHKATPTMIQKVLGLNLSDRVTLYEEETALSGVDFHIESIAHDWTSEYDHRVTLGLEMCPDVVTPDPDTLFQFNSTVAGHRFNEGVFVL